MKYQQHTTTGVNIMNQQQEYEFVAERLDHETFGYLVHKALLNDGGVNVFFDVKSIVWC
jgi:hypothetical protein